MTTADEKLDRLMLAKVRSRDVQLERGDYRDAQRITDHLATCPDLTVTAAEGQNGTYGCDTGCEFVRVEATAACPHEGDAAITYGEFGDLETLFDEMDRYGNE